MVEVSSKLDSKLQFGFAPLRFHLYQLCFAHQTFPNGTIGDKQDLELNADTFTRRLQHENRVLYIRG